MDPLIIFSALGPLLVEAGKAAVSKWLAPDEFKPVTIDDYVKMRSIDLEMFKAMQDKGGVGYPWVDAITRLMRPAVAGIVLSTWAWLHAQGGTDAGAADAFAGAVGFYLFGDRTLVYVVRLEKRIYALELILKMRIEALPCWKTAGSCNHVESTS